MIKTVNNEKYEVKDGVIYIIDPDTSIRDEISANKDEFFNDTVLANIYLDEDISDSRIVDWYYSKGTFTWEEYNEFLDSFHKDYYNSKAETFVRFLLQYEEGAFCPNRWGEYEPVRKLLNSGDEDSIRNIISKISFPMSSVFFKRVGTPIKYQLQIDNGDHRAYFMEKGKGKNKHWVLWGDGFKKRTRGESSIRILTKISELKKKQKTPIQFVEEFVGALCQHLKVYKYNIYVEKDPSFYRKPTKEVIFYDIPEAPHWDWRED